MNSMLNSLGFCGDLNIAATIEHSENKVITRPGSFETRSDLECSSPALNKHARCKNVKATRRKCLTIFQFCSFCLEFL